MAKIISAVLTALTLLLLVVTGFTLWGTLAFLLAAAALVGVCFFGEKLSGKMAFIGVAVATVSFLVSALFGAPGMPHFAEAAQSDVSSTEENQEDNRLPDSAAVAEPLVPYFDGTGEAAIATSLDSYKAIDAWQEDMTMTEDAFERLLDIIDNAGELEKRVPLTDLADLERSAAVYAALHAA